MKKQYRQLGAVFAAIWLLVCVLVSVGLFSVGIYVVRPAEVVESPQEERLTEEDLQAIQELDNEERTWDSFGDPDVEESYSGPVGALPSRDEWIAKFNKAKRSLVKHGKPLCEGCGRSPEECGKVTHDAHHVISVERIETELNLNGSARWPAEMKWDADNLIILCRPSTNTRTSPDDKGCHFLLGHRGESWSVSDPEVRKHAASQLSRFHPGKSYSQLVEEYFENSPQIVPQSTGEPRRRSSTQAKRTVAP